MPNIVCGHFCRCFLWYSQPEREEGPEFDFITSHGSLDTQTMTAMFLRCIPLYTIATQSKKNVRDKAHIRHKQLMPW